MPDAPAPARAASAAPTLTEPIDGAVAPRDTVVFRWSAPPGASAFDLRVAAAASPDTVLVELGGLPSTEATLADALPTGDLLWWVRQDGGTWSAPGRFRAGSQADLEVARRAEIQRADARRAADRAPEPSEALALAAPPPDPIWPYVSGEAVPGAAAVDWGRVPGFGRPTRTERAVSGDAPTPLAPLGGQVVDAGTVSLEWAGTDAGDRYEVELSPSAGFDTHVLTLDAGSATEIALPGLVPSAGRKLLWRVRALTGDTASPWSRYGRFYPADPGTAEQFSSAMERALTAQRLQRDHARRVQNAELELVPLHERPDAVTSSAAVWALLAMIVSSGVLIALAALFAFVWL